MPSTNEKISQRIPKLIQQGKVKEALTFAGDLFDTVAAANSPDLRRLDPNSYTILRDLMDEAAKQIPDKG